MTTLHDSSKTATLAYLNGYGDVSRAIRECYTAANFNGIVDALATYGPWDKRKRAGELGKRIASLRVLLHRIGAELQDAAATLGQTLKIVTIESKDGKPLNIVEQRAMKQKAERPASFVAVHKMIESSITELLKLQSVPGFADFHTAACQALTRLEAIGDFVQTTETRVTGVEPADMAA